MENKEMRLDKEEKGEIIFPEIVKRRKTFCFSGKNERHFLVVAISTSLILHTLVTAYFILLLRDIPIESQHFSTAMQIIPVSLDKEDTLASPMRHVHSLQPEKTSHHKDTPRLLSPNDGINVRTKTDEMKFSPLAEGSTNSTYVPETAYAIFSDLITHENLLKGQKDHQNLTKSLDALTMPRYLKTPKPPYPLSARIKGYDGVVFLRVEVLKSGRVGHISIIKSSGYDILDKAALDTVTRWQFESGRNKEQIQDMIIDIPVRFSLNN